MTHFSLVFQSYLGALQSPFGNKMETIYAHIVTNLNAIAMNFHQKTTVDSLL
jgi:hypothetical protein